MTRPVKRSFSIKGHRTSISIEAPFWDALRQAAAQEGMALAALVAQIDANRGEAGLSSAVRVWVLDYFREGTKSAPASEVTSPATAPKPGGIARL